MEKKNEHEILASLHVGNYPYHADCGLLFANLYCPAGNTYGQCSIQ